MTQASMALLQDLVFEVNGVLADERMADPQYRSGLRRIAKMLHDKLDLFEINQSNFAAPLIDVDEWFAGRA